MNSVPVDRWVKEVRPAFWGKGWPRAIRSGTGGGWDVTGSRFLILLSLAGAGGGDRRAGVAERDPDVGIALRLALDEAVSGLGPGHDVFVLVVQNELALVALHGQHGMAFAELVAHHRDQKRFARPTGIHQHLAFQQHVIFTVAVAVGRQRPFLDYAPMLHVGHGL